MDNNSKTVNVSWVTDRYDDYLGELYKSITMDLISLELSNLSLKELHTPFDKEYKREIVFNNYIIKTVLGANSNFSVGGTIAALNNGIHAAFVIPPDLIDYINEEIPNTDIFSKYVASFPSTYELYDQGKKLYEYFINEGYPSQAAYSLCGAAYVECAWNPNVYNKSEKSKSNGTASGAGGWSGCGEGLFGLTFWKQKEKIIKSLNLNKRQVTCYQYSWNKINKGSIIECSIPGDQKEYDKGPGRHRALLFQCTEDIWVKILKEYLSSLGMHGSDDKKTIDYILYNQPPKGLDTENDDDHRLLYATYLFKAGYGTGGTTFDNLKKRVEAYKTTHNRIYKSKNPSFVAINGFVKQLLIGYLLSEYVTGTELSKLNLKDIVNINDNYINGNVSNNSSSSLEENTGLFKEVGNIKRNNEVMEANDSTFIKSNKKYDVDLACEWLRRNSANISQHNCAKYVRQAIEAGFRDKNATVKRPNWAWKYIHYLPTIGFKLFKIVYRDRLREYTPQLGDIAVYLKDNDKNVPGHICMYTGDRWTSDFKQNNMFVYKGTKEAYIFRFVDNDIEEG